MEVGGDPDQRIRICTAPRLPSRYVPHRPRVVEPSEQERADKVLNEQLSKALKALVETRPPNPIKFLAYELFRAGGVLLVPGTEEHTNFHAARRIQSGLRGRYARRRVQRIAKEKKRVVIQAVVCG
eukprot:TRINITY_DN1184_c0_g1_i2.p3 TRINITY_DN1184_c0_g1~~TRINITY_DN1184_c0_g1_i2.p3  ORF type:complete len:126 (+),score=24.00 TRINITY_DN1184_c0_g1_i2:187-564(+)